jgi:hypothetical protein
MESKGPPGSEVPARARRGLVTPLLILLVLVLAAAAIYPELKGSADEKEEIEELVVYMMDTADPAMCTEVFTDRWLATYFSPRDGQDSISRCREANSEAPDVPSTTTVKSVSVDGDRATVTASTKGGPFGEGTFDLLLAKEDAWRVDELTEVNIDLAAHLEAMRSSIDAESTEAQQALSRCAIDWAERNVTAGEIERAILSSTGYSFLAGSYEACRSEFEGVFFVAGETSASHEQVACFISALQAVLKEADRKRLFESLVSGDSIPPDILAKRNEAAALCMGSGSSPAAPA